MADDSWLSVMTDLDMDEIMAYKTAKVVKILDSRLGMISTFLQACVVFYILGVVFSMEGGHLATEIAAGVVIPSVSGSTHSKDSAGNLRVWDPIDVMPSMENGMLFVPTEIAITTAQTMGNCSNPQSECAADKDCKMAPPFSMQKCEKGACMELGWCPNPTKETSDETEIATLENPNEFLMWFRSGVQFPSLSKTFFTTIGDEKPVAHPHPHATQFTVGQILELGGLALGTIKTSGCVLLVRFSWDCRVDGVEADCFPRLLVDPLSTSYSVKTAEYWREEGEAYRELRQMKGVKLMLKSEGLGKSLSLMLVVLHISSGLALLGAASFVADFVMLFILSEREHYGQFKKEISPDFSDLKNKISALEGEEKTLRSRKKGFKVSKTTGASIIQ